MDGGAPGRPAAPRDPAAGSPPLQATLQQALPGLQVERVATLPSTNTALLQRARAGAVQPCLLVAEQQTEGRGRQDRRWWSHAGASLTFSLGLPLAPADWSGLSLACGLALVEALAPLAGPAALGIKWPNDLWLRGAGGSADDPGRKLGGILIETLALPAAPAAAGRWTVIGVGLNVRLAADAADRRRYSSGFACIQEVAPMATAPAVLQQVAPALLRAVLAFESQGFAPLQPRFAAYDVLAGRVVRLEGPDGHDEQGVAAGVDATGRLRVHTAAGWRDVASGEVRVPPC